MNKLLSISDVVFKIDSVESKFPDMWKTTITATSEKNEYSFKRISTQECIEPSSFVWKMLALAGLQLKINSATIL